jgi:hypothetical protein
MAAWDDFAASRKDKPYFQPTLGEDGEGAAKQQALEARYFGKQ